MEIFHATIHIMPAIALAFIVAELIVTLHDKHPQYKRHGTKREKLHRVLRHLAFKGKFRILLFINSMRIPCRRYDRKPPHPLPQCHICAMKGGWPRCLRSKLIALKRNIKEHYNHTRRPQ